MNKSLPIKDFLIYGGTIKIKEKNQKSKETNRSYEPPKANFVPLKLEEKLLACTKTPGDIVNCTPGAFKDS